VYWHKQLKWRQLLLTIPRNNLSECQYVCCVASHVNWKPNHVLQTYWTVRMDVRTRFGIIRKVISCYMSHRYRNCLHYGKIRTQQYKQHKPWMSNRLLKEIYHWESEKCTVHRNRTHSERYTRNVYSAQKQHFPYCTSEKITVHINKNSVLYIRNVYWAQKQHLTDFTSEMFVVHRNRTLSRQYT